MKFDSEAWVYTDFENQMNQLEQSLWGDKQGRLTKRLKAEGGKGTGLLLASKIADDFLDPSMIFVPEHLSLNASDNLSSYKSEVERFCKISDGWILRSSTQEEDFIDHRCGVNDSYSRLNLFGASPDIEDNSPKLLNQNKNGIAQPFYSGRGYVVDFVYSSNFQQDVIHIGAGNFLTSATNDWESAHYILNMEGQLLLSSKEDKIPDYVAELLKVILPLKELPINFGFQLEVIDPRDHNSFVLVSFRPSPDRIRSGIQTPNQNKTPLFKTSLVSHSGVFEGEFYFKDTFEEDKNVNEEACTKAFQSQTVQEQLFKNSCVFWKDISYYRMSRREILCGGAKLGAAAQICVPPVFVNTNHDGFTPYRDYENSSIEEALKTCVFIGLPYQEFEKMEYGEIPELNNEGKVNIKIVSDGISAFIYTEPLDT